jgi:hypothetical protein
MKAIMVIIIKKLSHPLYSAIIPEIDGNNTQERPTKELNNAYKIMVCLPYDIPLIKEIYAVVHIPPIKATQAVTKDKYMTFLLVIAKV